jgi:hypothetical protein
VEEGFGQEMSCGLGNGSRVMCLVFLTIWFVCMHLYLLVGFAVIFLRLKVYAFATLSYCVWGLQVLCRMFWGVEVLLCLIQNRVSTASSVFILG